MVGSAAAYSIKQSELGRKRAAVSGFEMLRGQTRLTSTWNWTGLQGNLTEKRKELTDSQAADKADLADLRAKLGGHAGSFESIIEQLGALANFWQSVSRRACSG